ncbi:MULTISPECIES: MurR/RpiR family transcriptional regulator [Enterococcus]|uniref:RpiR family transcriptional regulator, glv operon transcriptional regulator n=1 Tax=Candidatus Enterococcus ferrettii TaxID=2815324 RepID=A0ABV0ESD0_9ENTE|nr:MurR/RpiR family transcriptional regulator [Enterococcus sp. 665A]MBO1340605.1 MurR/RpiR family transcriptional regulator [Enterococcus sp. 665A]
MTLEQLINEHHGLLNENDEYVLGFITRNMEKSIKQTVSELARQANVSDSTIIRLTKKLGFKGYGEFRYFLKEEYVRNQKTRVDMSDLFQPTILLEDVQVTIKLFEDDKSVEDIYEAIRRSKRIFAYATGHGQRMMLNEFARCMWNLGIYIIIVPEKNELKLISNDITDEDLLFVVSLSGRLNTLEEIVRKIQLKGTQLISVTRFGQNKLASLADTSLYYQVTNINNVNGLNNSSFCTLNLALSLLYEGYLNYQKMNS